MSGPTIVQLDPESPASQAGLQRGDEILAIDGQVPRDVLEYQWLVEDADPVLTVRRHGTTTEVVVAKSAGAAIGAQVHTPVFDEVTTCDNHCEFCFIHQLPAGLRPSLSVKDDDYRLSFLYGNFTTLTRFTEADLERAVTEGLSPLYVSLHATDGATRAMLLRNQRGATSLRWLRALLDHGIEVHGQVVVCPGRNDGAVLEDTMLGILDEYPELATCCVVPLGVSRFNTEDAMRPHTPAEAASVLATVHAWQATFTEALGRPLVHAADEYYLLAGEPFPPAESYGAFPMHEDGVGMARAFERSFHTGRATRRHEGPTPNRAGFFSWVDGAGPHGYRSPRVGEEAPVALRGPGATVTILTGTYGAAVLEPLLAASGHGDVDVVPVANRFFGGNIGVTGLLVDADVDAALASRPRTGRVLLPDVCLSDGAFLDGVRVEELCRPVEVVATDGASLRAALDGAVAP